MSGNVLPVPELNKKRRKAVQLRLDGRSLAQVSQDCGLSAPTIIAAVKAFKAGGWPAVDVKPRGRPRAGANTQLPSDLAPALVASAIGNDEPLWNTDTVRSWLEHKSGKTITAQASSALLRQWNLSPLNRHRQTVQSTQANAQQWLSTEYANFQEQSKSCHAQIWWLGTHVLPTGEVQIYAHNLRGLCHWRLLPDSPNITDYTAFLATLIAHIEQAVAIVLPSEQLLQDTVMQQWLEQANALAIAHNATGQHTTVPQTHDASSDIENTMTSTNTTLKAKKQDSLTHLQRLEAESIHILREVVAEANNPVMLYSAGKDSSVLLHLAKKAFYPAKLPFPLLHIDTGWEFQAMYDFRDRMVAESEIELLTHTNPEGIEKGVNPFTHGATLHTDIMKTEALKQALDKYGFDAAFAGARRDEEISRAKERVFSLRTAQHRWDPKNQRPEPWGLYNTRLQADQSLRVYPLSNWTEQDIWHYIYQRDIPIVSLYSAAERPVVERDNNLLVVDDDRMPLKEGEVPMMRKVRFRTLGCYPLTAAFESDATSLTGIIQELLVSRHSERAGRSNDNNSASSMEKKKQEGYF